MVQSEEDTSGNRERTRNSSQDQIVMDEENDVYWAPNGWGEWIVVGTQ